VSSTKAPSKSLVKYVIAAIFIALLGGGGFWAYKQKQARDEQQAIQKAKEQREATAEEWKKAVMEKWRKATEEKAWQEVKDELARESNAQKQAGEAEEKARQEEILQKELAELEQRRMAEEKARLEASRNAAATQTQSPVQSQAAKDSQFVRAAQCAPENCIRIMLEGVSPRKPEVIEAAASRIDGFEKPRRGDRKTARALNEKGLAEFRNNQYRSAADLLGQAARADPADVEIQSNLAFVALRDNQKQRALEAVIAALAMNPRRTSSWVSLSEIFVLSGHDSEATRAMLLAYEFSANKEKSWAFFEDKANTAERLEMRTIYRDVLEIIRAGQMN
jgi:hypothetical protein